MRQHPSSTPLIFQSPPYWLFEKFIFRPKAISKLLSIALMALRFCIDDSPKKMVSSVYWKILISTKFLPTKSRLNWFFSRVSLIRLINPSTTILNKRGANGYPYLSPFCVINAAEGFPLINMETKADLRHPSTQVKSILDRTPSS